MVWLCVHTEGALPASVTVVADVSFDEAVDKAREVIRHGGLVWQKFTCQNCGSRQMLDIPNIFLEHGTCEECGEETCIHTQGCGLMIAMHIPGKHRVGVVRNGNPTRAD